MRQYFKNILRTILQNKISYIGAVLIISMGSLIYVTFSEFLINLDVETDMYFAERNFADLFATVAGMPKDELNRLESVEGVDSVFGRLEGDIRLLLDDQIQVITLHVQAYSPDDTMNILTLDPAATEIEDDEIYLSPKIAKIYGIQKGDQLRVVANKKTYTLVCAGYGFSPEYMDATADESMMTSDCSVYDTAVMSVAGLEKILGQKNMVTNVGVMTSKGYTYSDIHHNVEQVLSDYGLEAICERKDQEAFDALKGEVESYEVIVLFIPTIFMAVTIFMLYIILKKNVDKDRILIGTMKAFGASDLELLRAYIVQALFIGLAGGILLLVPAELLGKYLFDDDMVYYNIPGRIFKPHPEVWLKSIGIDVFISILAVFLGVIDVMRINPAESMRSKAPAGGDVKLPAFCNRILNSRQKLGLMAVVRNKARAFVIAIAVAMPFAMTCSFPTFGRNADKGIEDQFTKIEGYDLKARLNEYIPYEEAESLVRSLDGISEGEAIASYSIKITGTNKYEYAPLLILNPGSNLFRIMSYEEKFYEPREDGLIISHHLADKLHVSCGDLVEVEGVGLTNTGQSVKMMVVDIVPDTFGLNCYLAGGGVERYFSLNRQGNLLLLNVEKGRMEDVLDQLSKRKNISYIVDSRKAIDSYKYMMETTVMMIDLMAIFSVISGVLIIYNVMGISIRERTNEFGTMMVLGMNVSEISEIVFFEQFINFFFGILFGFPIAELFRRLIIYASASDTETVMLTITPDLYLFSFVLCALAAIVSVILVLRELFEIQLTDVLKVRE